MVSYHYGNNKILNKVEVTNMLQSKRTELEAMKAEELRQMCKDMGISFYKGKSRLTKAEMIGKLLCEVESNGEEVVEANDESAEQAKSEPVKSQEEIEAEDLKNLKVSMVRLNANSLKIYSLQSNITDELVDLDFDLLFNDESDIYNKSNFFRMLLASVCSFQRRQELKGFNFCEEYVLPQMLAQILKRKGFDGVAYYSTKRYENLVYSEDGVKKDLAYFRYDNFEFKENIAIFTKINMEHVYDRELYDKIQISVPVSQQRIERITIEDIKELCELIAASKKQKNITAAEKIVSSFGRIYDKMYIDDQKYEQTEFGKLHCYLVFTVLSQILIS